MKKETEEAIEKSFTDYMESEEEKGESINEHYGISDKKLDKWAFDMLRDISTKGGRVEILDKWFSNMSDEDKVKIHAFTRAWGMADTLWG